METFQTLGVPLPCPGAFCSLLPPREDFKCSSSFGFICVELGEGREIDEAC